MGADEYGVHVEIERGVEGVIPRGEISADLSQEPTDIVKVGDIVKAQVIRIDDDDRTITLQYFEALKQLGESPATKYVVPLELTDLARRLGNFLDGGLDSGAAVRLSVEPESSGEDDASRDT